MTVEELVQQWAEEWRRACAIVIHHPEAQLSPPVPWDYSWTAHCPGCGAEAVWQQKPTEPAARIHCTCPTFFICQPCRDRRHDGCRGCDCQHRERT